MKMVFDSACDLANAGFEAGQLSVEAAGYVRELMDLPVEESRLLVGALCVMCEGVELAVAEGDFDDEGCECCYAIDEDEQ